MYDCQVNAGPSRWNWKVDSEAAGAAMVRDMVRDLAPASGQVASRSDVLLRVTAARGEPLRVETPATTRAKP